MISILESRIRKPVRARGLLVVADWIHPSAARHRRTEHRSRSGATRSGPSRNKLPRPGGARPVAVVRGRQGPGIRQLAGWPAGAVSVCPVLAPVSPPFLVASTCGQAAVRHAATARLAERAPPRPPLRYAAAADDCRAGSCMCAARAPHSPFCPCCTCCIVFYPLLQLSSVESLTQIWYSSVLLLRRGAVTHGVPTLQFAALAVWHIGTHGYE